MFRKLLFAVALALGIGGGAVAAGGAQAAVAHPATSNALIQAIEQGAPSVSTEVQYRRRWGYHRGYGRYGYRRYGYRHYGYRGYGYRRYGYHPYRYGYRCRWVTRRVHYRYRWVWVRRRVCW